MLYKNVNYIFLAFLLFTIIYIFSSFDKVSWYGPGFHGRLTANGEIYSQDSLTCASPYLPFNTRVWVENQVNCKNIIVRVNDRGPYKMDSLGKAIFPLKPHPTRVLDLSKAAFDSIADLDTGILEIKYKIVK